MNRIAIIGDSPTGAETPVSGCARRRRPHVAKTVCRESPPLAWTHSVNTLQGAG